MTTEIKINTINGKPLRIYIYKNGVENPDYPITTNGVKNVDHILLNTNTAYIKPSNDLSTYQVFIKAVLLCATSASNDYGLIIHDTYNGGEKYFQKTSPTVAGVEQMQVVGYFNNNLPDLYIKQINGIAKIYEIWIEKVTI